VKRIGQGTHFARDVIAGTRICAKDYLKQLFVSLKANRLVTVDGRFTKGETIEIGGNAGDA
jgi:hypothetical protein